MKKDPLEKVIHETEREIREIPSIDTRVFGKEILRTLKIPSTQSTKILDSINLMAYYDMDFALGMVEFLKRTPSKISLYVLETIAARMTYNPSEETLSESKIIMEIANKRKTIGEEETIDIIGRLRAIDDNDSFKSLSRYVFESLSIIKSIRESPQFRKALDTIVELSTHKSKRNNIKSVPAEVFRRALDSELFGQYIASPVSSRLSYEEIPADKIRLLELSKGRKREDYFSLLNEYPTVRFLSIERFVSLGLQNKEVKSTLEKECGEIETEYSLKIREKKAENKDTSFLEWYKKRDLSETRKAILFESVFGYITNWIGPNASKERLEFFLGIYDKFGFDGVIKLGKPMLETLYKRCKDNPELITFSTERFLPKIYAAIPEDNIHPPRWMVKVHESIDKLQSNDELTEFLTKYSQQALEIRGIKVIERKLRAKYSKLVSQIKNTIPVRGGILTTTDILLTLDSNLLDALARIGGKKGPILTSMGRDLGLVNKTYMESGISADKVIELYKLGHTHNQIRNYRNR